MKRSVPNDAGIEQQLQAADDMAYTDLTGAPEIWSSERLSRVIAKSPIPNFDDYLKEVVDQYAPSLILSMNNRYSPQEFAAKLKERYSLSEPQNEVAYQVLMNASPSLIIQRSNEGVYVRGRFKGNKPIGRIVCKCSVFEAQEDSEFCGICEPEDVEVIG